MMQQVGREADNVTDCVSCPVPLHDKPLLQNS